MDFQDELEMMGFAPSDQDEPAPTPTKPPEGLDIVFEEELRTEANFQGESVQDILGLLDKHEANIKHDQAIKHFEIDSDLYEEIHDRSSVIRNSVKEGQREYKVFDKLNKDIFFSLFKYKPEVRPESQMKRSTRFNNELVKRLVDTPEYRSLRQSCKLDMLTSAMGSEAIGKKAVEIIRHEKERVIQANEAYQQAQQNGQGQPGATGGKGKADPFDLTNKLNKQEELIDELMDQVDNIEDLIEKMKQQGLSTEDMQNRLNDAQLELETANALANALADELEDAIDDGELEDVLDDIVKEVSNAFSAADEEVSEVRDLIDQWGLSPGEGVRVNFNDKREAIERIRRSKKLKDLSELIGRFVNTAMADQKNKSKDGATSIKSVKTGNKIESVLPSEKMKLANPVTKKDFYRRYNQKELLTYELENTNKKKRGPMIVAIDTSGSMEGAREKWSKAMAIALLEIAQLQKRDYAAIIFESRVRDTIIIEKGQIEPHKVVDIAERFYNGGTDFEDPLNKAIELLKDSRFSKGDIIFITDGDCNVSESFLERYNKVKEEKNFSCKSILIDAGGGSASTRTLDRFSDEVIKISKVADLKNENSEVVHQIFGGV